MNNNKDLLTYFDLIISYKIVLALLNWNLLIS